MPLVRKSQITILPSLQPTAKSVPNLNIKMCILTWILEIATEKRKRGQITTNIVIPGNAKQYNYTKLSDTNIIIHLSNNDRDSKREKKQSRKKH